MLSVEPILSKLCTGCGFLLDIQNFNVGASRCKACRKVYNQLRYTRVKGDMLAVKATQYQEMKPVFSARQKVYRENNPEKVKATRAQWVQNNKSKVTANTAQRRAKKLNATPLWLDSTQRLKINLYYLLARKLGEIHGEIYHVDHIVPLQGANVCGLHVPWNLQVITAKENFLKGIK